MGLYKLFISHLGNFTIGIHSLLLLLSTISYTWRWSLSQVLLVSHGMAFPFIASGVFFLAHPSLQFYGWTNNANSAKFTLN